MLWNLFNYLSYFQDPGRRSYISEAPILSNDVAFSVQFYLFV